MEAPHSPPIPSRRRNSYLTPPNASVSAQQRRREAALAAQQSERQHRFMQARELAASGLEELGDLILADEEDEDDEATTESVMDVGPEGEVQDTTKPKRRTGKGKAAKKYKTWAKDVLMWAETLDLSKGLPAEFYSLWSAVVVPEGKRCLCVSGSSSPPAQNTVLLSRVSGRTLQRRQTVLPPQCMLDAVFDEENNVLHVLDLIQWRGQWFLECEAEMRFFFLASKLAELPLQTYLPPSSTNDTSRTPLLVLGVPKLDAPLIPATLIALIASLSTPSLQPTTVLVPTPNEDLPWTETVVSTPFKPTGLLVFLIKAHYESGTTALAGWVPLEVETKGVEGLNAEEKEGVKRLLDLVQESEMIQ